eukprot:TRINITY_DN7793_c0_g1_i2.p1 TRINITY_DN7793_c0_g1~~TRINITY_DN7793_c0_g1_i2.p1  ORF type:complete len:818 (+),score=214.68 TRINITY_DN7793_c0_g1_i2:80-2533(+)
MESRRRMRRLTYTVGRETPGEAVAGGVTSLCTIPQSGGWVASGGRDGVVRVWRHGGGGGVPELQRCFEGHLDWVNDVVAISPRLLASGSSDSQVKVWDIAEETCVATLSPHFDYVKKLAYSEQMKTLFAASFDGTLSGIDVAVASGAPSSDATDSYTFAGLYRSVYALATRGSLVSVGTSDHSIRSIDWRSGSVVSVLAGHKDIVRGLDYVDDDPNLLVSTCSDHTIRLWDVRAERVLVSLAVHASPVWCVEGLPKRFVPKAAVSMITGARDGTVFATFAGSGDDVAALADPKRVDGRHVNTTLVAAVPKAPITALALSAPYEACGEDDGGPLQQAALWVGSSSSTSPLTVWDAGAVLAAPRVQNHAPPLQLPRRHSSFGPQTPPPPAAADPAESCDDPITVHHLAHSHIERHTFSLPTPFVRAAPSVTPGVKGSTAEDEAERFAAFITALSPALQQPLATCRTQAPVVEAKLLDNRRHCLAKASDGRVDLWDLLNGARCAIPPGVLEPEERHGAPPPIDVMADRLAKLCSKVAAPSWCTLDVSTGVLTVQLDHPSVFSCETWAWEKELMVPNTPAPALSKDELAALVAERPEFTNFGESVVLGLFRSLLAPLPFRWLCDAGDAPTLPSERRAWREAHTHTGANRPQNAAQAMQTRCIFNGLPESTVVSVWSRRGGFEPNMFRHEPPKGGVKVVFAMDTEPYQPHTRCTVADVADVFAEHWRVPSWVADIFSRPAQVVPAPQPIRFVLESLKRGELPNLPYDSRVLSGPPKFRIARVAEKIVGVLKLRLPAAGPPVDGRTEYLRPEECLALEADGQV